jgi:hypothetical protein
MADPGRFRYTTLIDPTGARLIRPILSVSLAYRQRRLTTEALVDSGADANVLPYQVGLDLGANWNDARPVRPLSGNLGQVEARAIALQLTVPTFAPAWMVFIWVKTDIVRFLLGQINFFQEFDVCFFGADDYFEVRRKK